jgi:pyruvate/2-oxoglutarate dehydrogenase complex dihydrolipoamide acyltransferase (E2) component
MKRIGDRKDAKKVRNLDGLHNVMIDIKPERCDSDVYMNKEIDVTKLIKYVEKYKKEHPDDKITYFHAFAMAFAKTIYNKPLLNRFVANRTFYDRNDVIIAFVAKIAFEEDSEEVMINIKVDKDDNIFTLRDKITKRVAKIRNSKKGEKKENTNNIVDVVGKLPKLIRMIVTGTLKFLDKHGWLPESITKDNLYYSSVILSNLGNFKIGSIYHNIVNFGTSSIIATMGMIHKSKVIDKDGKEKIIDVCDFGVNMDERIADGYYFAKSIKVLEYILDNPELLEDRADARIEIDE